MKDAAVKVRQQNKEIQNGKKRWVGDVLRSL